MSESLCRIWNRQRCFLHVRKKVSHSLPLVADIHFDYRLALAAIDAGADKIRINPGNIGENERLRAVVEAAKTHDIPIRVGVNSGSLEKPILEKYGRVTGGGPCRKRNEQPEAYRGIRL